jgi:hypothetical protein
MSLSRRIRIALTNHGFTVKPPRDLRYEYRPVLSRLSQGFAGMPGNDAMDYTMIRDDWFYSKSRSTIRKNREQKQLRYTDASMRRPKTHGALQHPCGHV